MSDHRTAELIGAHLALSTPIALAWCRVAHGELAPDRAAALMQDPTEREHARQIFTPPTPRQRDQQLAALFARLGPRPSDHE